MIAVIVPTIRPEQFNKFLEAWTSLFKKHSVVLYKVTDGEEPTITKYRWIEETDTTTGLQFSTPISVSEVMGIDSDLIYNKCDAVRNLGFVQACKDGADYFISLDDDVSPVGDPIQAHINILNMKFPISWMDTAASWDKEIWMRGVPYGVRQEAECVLSHGGWRGVPDLDASTQLLNPDVRNIPIMEIAVPKGVLFPICAMNFAFKRKLMPHVYQAPAYGEYQRFSDIWAGINMKKAIDENGWSAYTGGAMVYHERASNPFKNLQKEAKGVELNETYFKGDETDPYFKVYNEKRKRWEELFK